MAVTSNDYCPIIHQGFGFEVAQRINDMYAADADRIVALLRMAYGYDSNLMISDNLSLTVDEFIASDGMKKAISELFGYGESTFVVDTPEELQYFTNAYENAIKSGHITEDGTVTIGGLEHEEQLYNIFTRGARDDYEIYDRIKSWKDNEGKLHMVIPKPRLNESSDIQFITVAPYFRQRLTSKNREELEKLTSSAITNASRLASMIGIEIRGVNILGGTYLSNSELSYKYVVSSESDSQVDLLAALMGDLSFEYQDATIASRYLSEDQKSEANAFEITFSAPQDASIEDIEKLLKEAGIEGSSFNFKQNKLQIIAFEEQDVQTLIDLLKKYEGYEFESAAPQNSRYIDAAYRKRAYQEWLNSEVGLQQSGSELHHAVETALEVVEQALKFPDENQEKERYEAVKKIIEEYQLSRPTMFDDSGEMREQYDRPPLVRKVISGAQTGVDTLGLIVAHSLGIETGGTTTPGFVREKGVDKYTRADLEKLGVVEISPTDQEGATGKEFYLPRTRKNVMDSDGTVYFASDSDRAGLIATQRFANQFDKPFIINPTAVELRRFIRANNIQTLNVAGNRGSRLKDADKIEAVLREGLLEAPAEELFEDLTPADLRGLADYLSIDESTLRHNKAIQQEMYEKALEYRKVKDEKRQSEKEKDSPLQAFRRKFRDRNMLNFLSEVAVRRISNIVSELQDDENRENATRYFGDRFANKDFTQMTRKEILLDNEVFTAIVESAKYADFSALTGWTDEFGEQQDNNPMLDEIIEMIYSGQTKDVDNFRLLLQHGRDLLKRNEGLILNDNNTVESINEENDPENAAEEQDQISYEEGEGNGMESDEQYKLAEPSVPAMRKVTERIKIMLANIPQIDVFYETDGTAYFDNVSDPWGFGMPVYIDPGRASNTIHNILSGAETKEEMIERLKSQVETFPWLQYVVDRIDTNNEKTLPVDKEKLRTEFFVSFRKDKTVFSGVKKIERPDGSIDYVYVEKNRGSKGRKNKINLKEQFEAKEGIPLFAGSQIDFSGTSQSSPFWYVFQEFYPTKSAGLGATWNLLHEMYEEDPDELYGHMDRTMRQDTSGDSILYPIYQALHHFGIDCEPSAFYSMAMADYNGASDKFAQTNIGRIVSLLNRIAIQLNRFNPRNQDKIAYYNPLIFNTDVDNQHLVYITPLYNEIIDIISAFTESDTESVAHVNGRAHYAFNYPTFLQTTVSKLANQYGSKSRLNEFFERRYNNDWYSYTETVKDPVTGEEREERHYYIDILEKLSRGQNPGRLEYVQQLDYDGIDYKDMSPKSYAISILVNYFYQADRNTGLYRSLIASDKPNMDNIRWVREHNLAIGSTNYKVVITDQVWKVVLQEINRSRRVLDRALRNAKKIANFDVKLKGEALQKHNEVMRKMANGETVTKSDLFVNDRYIYAKSGVGFKFVRVMQDALVDSSDTGDILVNQARDNIQQAIIDSIFNGKDSIKDQSENFSTLFSLFMEARIKSNIDFLTDIGVLEKKWEKDEESGMFYYTYPAVQRMIQRYAKDQGLNEVLATQGIDAVLNEMLGEFAYNNFIMQIQQAEILGVDLAYYKGTTDFQKRFAQTRSTGSKLDKTATIFGQRVTNGKLNTITLATPKHVSYAKDDIKGVLYGYSNTIKNDQERLAFRKSIPGIIKMYESVDPTDGQAWNTISGLRAKHVSASKWTYAKDDKRIGDIVDGEVFLNENSDTDEAVYRRMKLGKPLHKDFFHVFTQIDKPFVYDVSVRDGMPVPVQQKNAEYTYVLVNQFMSNFKKNDSLSVLISAIEKTFDRNGVFEKTHQIDEECYVTGIHTANFDSAVKVGTTEGISLESKPEDLVVQLNRLFHLTTKDPITGEEKEGGVGYEPGVITEIDVDSYSYQQNNPEKFINHRQLLGSQQKILSFANTRDDDVIDIDGSYTALASILNEGQDAIYGKDLKAKYFDVLRERTVISDQIMRQELGLNSSERVKMSKIAEKLQKSIAQSRKYSSDDRLAVQLFGRNFLLAAEDAAQAENIKAITASWVRKVLYRQEILGGPLVQATGFGRSKELKTVIEDGKLKHFQTIVPMQEQIAALLRDKNGLISPRFFDYNTGEYKFWAIKEYLKSIGAEGMLRLLLYRIPTEGKYSVFPCEIVGFAPSGGGSTVLLPDDGTTIAGFDFDTDKLFAIMKEFASRNGKPLFKEGKLVEYTPSARSKYGQMAGYNNVLFDMQWLSLTTLESAAEIFDPGQFEDLTELSFKIELMRALDGNDNHLFTQEEIDNMSVDEMKETWEDINDLDITDLKTMITLHNQNMSMREMLGIAAVSNISHAQISMFTEANPIYEALPSKSTINLSWTDTLGRKREVRISEKISMDQRLDMNGELISKHLRKYVGLSADAAKNPTGPRLHIDNVTFPVVQWLIRAGVPKELAHKFTNLNVFSELSKVYMMLNDDAPTSVNAAIHYLEAKIFDSDRQLFGGFPSAKDYREATFYKDGFRKKMDMVLSEDELEELIYNPSKLNAIAYFNILEQFAFMNELADTWSVLSRRGRINSAVAGPKATIEENQSREEKFDEVKKLFSGKKPKVLGMTYEKFLSLMPYESQMHESVRGLLDAIQGDIFPSYQSPTYRSAIQIIETIVGRPLNAEQKERFNQAQKMMALSLPSDKHGWADFYMLYDPAEAKRYYRDFPDWYAKELKELKELNVDLDFDLSENLLLQLIGDPQSPTVSVPIKTLNTAIFGADETYKFRITQAWLDLITYDNEEISKETNERVHRLGLELFRYFTLRNGGKSFDAKTPWHLAPLQLKVTIPGYNERLKDISSFTVNETTLAIQFMLNNAKDPKIMTKTNLDVFNIPEGKPRGEMVLSEDDLERIMTNAPETMITIPGVGVAFKPMLYVGNNAVLILGDSSSIRAGMTAIEPQVIDEENSVLGTRIKYRIVPAMGIPGVISEYYPMLRTSVYNFTNAEGAFADEFEQDIRGLEDLEDTRSPLVKSNGVNVNDILNEVIAGFGYKFNDVVETNPSNFSVTNTRLKNYLKLTDKALLQKLGIKAKSTFAQDEKRLIRLLDEMRERIKDIC